MLRYALKLRYREEKNTRALQEDINYITNTNNKKLPKISRILRQSVRKLSGGLIVPTLGTT